MAYGLRVWTYRRLGAQIGRNVRLYGALDGANPQLIAIGENTVIGTQARILAHCPIRGSLGAKVGKNCFVGYAALILPGVTVGDNCVIGAGSVVTHDVPADSIAAGNPARVLRRRDPDELARFIERMEKGLPIGPPESPSEADRN
jgi:acetyltransferase-like isoleucine patch superfamily enzyme